MWYYSNLGQRQGPVAEEEFNRLVREGTIRGDTLVWREGMANWQPYSELAARPGGVPQLVAAGQAVDETSAVCAVSGKTYPKREMLQLDGKWISAEHRDKYLQRAREGVALDGEVAPFGYGGFWIRFVARIIDGIIMMIPIFIMAFVVGLNFTDPEDPWILIVTLIGAGLSMAYEVFFLTKNGATPGKMALNLKVVRSNGAKLTVGRAFGRHLASSAIYTLVGLFIPRIQGLLAIIDCVPAAFDREKRAIHDRICDTRVVKRK